VEKSDEITLRPAVFSSCCFSLDDLAIDELVPKPILLGNRQQICHMDGHTNRRLT
jgi:hypothetical protein